MKYHRDAVNEFVAKLWAARPKGHVEFLDKMGKEYRACRAEESQIENNDPMTLTCLLMNESPRQTQAAWRTTLARILRSVDVKIGSCLQEAGSEYRQVRAKEALAAGDTELALVLLTMEYVETVSGGDGD